MNIKISKSNSKLGIIPSINMPPIITCRENLPCSKKCYALKGRFRLKNVKDTLFNNYEFYKQDPKQYFEQIKKFIDNGITTYRFFRWHSSGDIIDENYLSAMVKLANELPETNFLAFTKKFEMVNEYVKKGNVIPNNLNIVFSAWDKYFKIDNPYNFPVAYVEFNNEALNRKIPQDAIKCSGNCTRCLQCWNIKKGESVVFHEH